jgi:hypothetical protein
MLEDMKRDPPAPTLEELRRDCPWCWVVCERCLHRKAVAFVPFIIRWGPGASSDILRRSARCEKCGAKGGASLQHPSWAGMQVGWEPFPARVSKCRAPEDCPSIRCCSSLRSRYSRERRHFRGRASIPGVTGESTGVADILPDRFAFIGFVGRDQQWRARYIERCFGRLTVVNLAAGQQEIEGPAFAVDGSVDLRRAAAAAAADRLIFLFPLAPAAARCAWTIVLLINSRLSFDFAAIDDRLSCADRRR